MQSLATLTLAAGLLALAGCAERGPEIGPRHDVKVRVEIKVPFSADYNWSFQAMDEYKGKQQPLASNSGHGGYYYESFEHNEGNMEAGHVLTTAGTFSPGSNRAGALPPAAYISMKIVVDGDVKADTTINWLTPTTSGNAREAKLRVTL